ncbi:hypothetical protein [Paenibacillus cisolokensis]|uniref:hypothetical protein n=1 Tax=Paenibacillus cisolokensis TaxID=1658519 RepID=UPI001BCAE4EB|nr:hypothetical protein [Paenibacillus cisolokensis]
MRLAAVFEIAGSEACCQKKKRSEQQHCDRKLERDIFLPIVYAIFRDPRLIFMLSQPFSMVMISSPSWMKKQPGAAISALPNESVH